jgi:Fibronectin type III domain
LCIDSLGGVTMTPSDSFGNTWISIAGPTSTTTGSDLRTQLWYAWNPMVGPGHTVTVTLSKGEPVVMAVLVVQNANVSSPIDGVSLIGSDNGTSFVAVTSPNLITTLNNDLLLGFAKDAVGATFTAGAGFTLQAAASSQFLAAETGVAATPGTYNATFTLSTGQTWQALITAAANNPNQATVSWTASTEPSGTIANYLVWRCQGPGCNNYAQIATVPATSTTFNDLGLTPGTMYSYEVQAEDAAFTVGPFSTAAVITTPAAIPSLPGSLTVGAASGTQNILSWTASLETGGGTIFQYLVESCQGPGCNSFSQIGTSPTPGYTDNSVSPGVSYTYRVRAQDAAGTLGPYSNVASDVTP